MEAFNVTFVGIVEKYPVLYDFTLMEYSRKDVTDQAWHKVAAEVNLSVSKCKERWKNLRTAFLRNLKASPRGSSSKTRKAYYLHEALQFILPFSKATHLNTGNLTEYTGGPEVADVQNQDSGSLVLTPARPPSADCDPLSPSPPSPQPTTTPTPSPIRSSGAEYSMSPALELSIKTESRQLLQSEASPAPRQQTSRKRKSASECDVDRPVAEYCAAKKSTLCSKEGRKEAIVQFLNSLVPDLLTLTDPQLRFFKRRTLLLIDEVTGTIPLESVCGPSYAVFPNAPSSQTPSPASSFLSS